MKNIPFFAVLVIINLIGIFLPLHGQENNEKNYSFTISPQTGFIYGKALELLYQLPGWNDSEYMSKLFYEVKPVYYIGLNLGFEKNDIMSKSGFFSSVSFKLGIPADSGIHENRDWQSNTHNNMTDFSHHTNRTKAFYNVDFILGMSIPGSMLYIKPFISGSWMHFSFEGRDGYGEYPEKTSPMNYIDYTGQKIITYRQNWFLAAIGFSVGTKAISPFSFELSFRISPLTYCIAFNEHLAGVVFPDGSTSVKQTWKDYTQFGIYIEPGLNMSLFAKNIDYSLAFNYRYISRTRGFSFYSYNNLPTYNSPNDSGAGISFLDVCFLVKFRF